MTGIFLTEDRLAIRDMARELAMTEVLPLANELDPVHGEIPMALREKMAELGFFGILVPEEYGGLGLGLSEYAILVEELARAWMSVASLIARGQQFTAGFGPEQRERYLPVMARGELLSAFALSEAEAGSDVANLSCRAVPDGDGWRITGQKMWCTFADGADYLQVFARTAPVDPAHRSRGVTCFLMPKGRHGRLDTARIHTAARAIGLARGALEDAITYAGQHVQFGRPIGENQGIRFTIADMAAQVEASRALMYQVCTAVDAGRQSPVEASMVKLVASEMAERVTSEGLQIHGGAGYTTDFPVERHWRDARLTKIFEGTSEIQMRIISDALLGRPDARV